MSSPVREPCEFKHEFDERGICEKCGHERPLTPEELCRREREAFHVRRNTKPVEALDKKGRLRREVGTWLGCPKCRSEHVYVNRTKRGKKSRKAQCLECEYTWRTISKEAFGGFRNVEVRG